MLVHQGSWEAEQLWTQLLSGSPLALPGSVSDEYTLFRRHYPKHFSHTKLSEHHSKMLLTRLVLWKPFCRAQQILAPRFWQLSTLKAHSIFSTYIEKICSLNASPRNRKCFLWPYLLTWCLIWDREWGAMWEHHSLGCQSLLGRVLIKDSEWLTDGGSWRKNTWHAAEVSVSVAKKKKKKATYILVIGDLEKSLQVMLYFYSLAKHLRKASEIVSNCFCFFKQVILSLGSK